MRLEEEEGKGRSGPMTVSAHSEQGEQRPHQQQASLAMAAPPLYCSPLKGDIIGPMDESDHSTLVLKPEDTPSPRAPRRKLTVRSMLQRLVAFLVSIPSYWWVALVLFMVLETVAVVGSVYYARSEQQSRIAATTEVALTASRALEKLLDGQKAPILAVANLVALNPHWPTFNASFVNFSMAIYENYAYYEIEACPYGVVAAMNFPWYKGTGQELYDFKLSFDYEKDLLDPARPDWQLDIDTISQNKSIILVGPWYGDGPLASGAFVLRYSIFLPAAGSASWDMPPSSISTCHYSVCNTPDNRTWWGWANSVFVWDDIKAGLAPLDSHGLLYTLAPIVDQGTYIAATDPLPNNGTHICVNVNVFGWEWPLCVDDPAGRNWWPTWFPGLIVGVTALSLLISGMVLLILRSRAQAMSFLARQVMTNRELAAAKEVAESGQQMLEEEKARMQVLMGRQYQLIALFGSGQGGGGGSIVRDSMRSESSGVGARDRIEELRNQLSRQHSSNPEGAVSSEICLQELLGEGSFGKVYRGTWRGTEVAIKTMVLPSYMSGKEKREKMLIMETAISSALAHPNIVQTFTYSIDNIVENSDEVKDPGVVPTPAPAQVQGCIVIGGQSGANGDSMVDLDKSVHLEDSLAMSSSPPEGGSAAQGASAAALGLGRGPGPARRVGAIHGYEVRLVLEFCDKGCLRDALGQHAFLGQQGLNYKGILDTAMDVTRAMLHLHLADVLHGDLKARNVMLKSSGAEGRGLVAKVADFGLAIKIDTTQQTHMSNLFQGTLTHMSPELLLHGRMSKAADVYAFGILLWELFTAGEPFEGVPQALLGHQVIHEHKRPAFPMRPPEDFLRLVNDCWAADPLTRPGFDAILHRLKAMRDAAPGPTAPLVSYTVPAPQQAALPRVNNGVVDSGPFNMIANQAFMAGKGAGLGMSVLRANVLEPVEEERSTCEEENAVRVEMADSQ